MKQMMMVILATMTMNAWAVDLGDLDKQLKEKLGDQPITKESVQQSIKQAAPENVKAVLPTSEQEELKVGREVAANLLGAAPLVNDAGLQHYVNTVGRWVSMQS